MLKRIDHVGVVVDDLDAARQFLSGMGMKHDRDLDLPGRLKASFYTCGDVQIEVIDISDSQERRQRLGSDRARIEHIAIEVDDIARTIGALAGLGVKTQTADPITIGTNLAIWTVADSCDGVVYQLVEKHQ